MFWIIGGGDLVKGLLSLIMNPMPKAIAFQFEHVEWTGFAAWDLIMPLFLFLTGISLPFSMSRRLTSPEDRKRVYFRIAKRFVILFIIGMAVQGNLLYFDLSRLHIYCNTLQAIAFGYVIAAVAMMNLGIVLQAALCAALMAGYWLLMVLVPVPGHGAGLLEPQANLALYIDQIILGRFRDGTEYTWILSGMTFAATVLLGVMSGHLLRSRLEPLKKAAAIAGVGIACLVAGRITAEWFPIIKHIWSPSFVFWSAGWCFLLVSLFYWVIDILGVKKWAFFFIVIGSNALFVYTLTELLGGYMPESVESAMKAAPVVVQAAVSISVFAGIWLLLYYMFKKRIFLRV
jgi:predicted acyltransferase